MSKAENAPPRGIECLLKQLGLRIIETEVYGASGFKYRSRIITDNKPLAAIHILEKPSTMTIIRILVQAVDTGMPQLVFCHGANIGNASLDA